ncbi:hypothetical protein PV682_28325 [Streptomyces niveiscabiei]|uniref:hypothetical protein n=1 Tax=Streptomyces niveiscabiei TaxID=164115 RepID=UPI0029A4098A|nr:hypothetical protein [Streptomyces niveiscabiei]MDX3385350.1 hypothetical protein [Streptomyces niveiscabiei]
MKRGLALAATVAALSMGAVGTASAETHVAPSAKSDAGILAAPPQCIEAWYSDGYAYADSECGSSYRIKFAWAYGADSECFTIGPGELWSQKRAHSWMRFDGIRSC